MNITDPIRRQAAAAPRAAAIVRRGATVSYRQLDRLLDVLARRALDVGLRAGDLVEVAPLPLVETFFAITATRRFPNPLLALLLHRPRAR